MKKIEWGLLIIFIILLAVFAFQVAHKISTVQVDRIITLSDAGSTITLNKGNTILLALGTSYDWTAQLSNTTVLNLLVKVKVANGEQGVYRADNTGETTLIAAGVPACVKNSPPCEVPTYAFNVKFIIK